MSEEEEKPEVEIPRFIHHYNFDREGRTWKDFNESIDKSRGYWRGGYPYIDPNFPVRVNED